MTSKSGRLQLASDKREDNSDPSKKLQIRRHFLSRYHANTVPVVLDCCQAEARLWTTLRREFTVKYWGVDRVGKRGRLTIDSVRLLAQPGLPYDVIDVDTYGSPWQHWTTLLPNLRRPTTVFLTLGHVGGITAVDGAVLHALGLSRMRCPIPNALRWKLDALAVGACFAQALTRGLEVVEAVEVTPPAKNARYFGVHLRPHNA
ncbi:MAG TPA: hypothetical protein VH539_06985 [Gemmatimonadaceae bacterium]|jgi:hypothetical protein